MAVVGSYNISSDNRLIIAVQCINHSEEVDHFCFEDIKNTDDDDDDDDDVSTESVCISISISNGQQFIIMRAG